MLKKSSPSNDPETIKSLVGETIKGVICDTDGKWWLITATGHALVLGTSALPTEPPGEVRSFLSFHVEEPYHVKKLIEKHTDMLNTWEAERRRLADIAEVVKGR